MTAAETRTSEAPTVKPSARDPIAQWLDVFTSLLGLPASETQRIRDELEDHLRTRVDDLLILGLSEPEAVQRAVTELGETAQLARNFRSVRTHSRRRIAMHTALFAVAGLALTVSVAGLIPRSPAPAFAPIATVQPEEIKLKALGVDLPGGTLEATLNTIAEATGARLFVHWNALEGFSGLERDSELGPIPAKDLDGAKILELMNSMLNLSEEGMLAVRHEGNLVEVANVAYFDRIETVTVDYDVSKLVPAQQVLEFTAEGQRLKENIEVIVEPTVWQTNGGEATLTMSGSLLTVRAPKRIQEMVSQYIEKLRTEEEKRQAKEARKEKEARSNETEHHAKSLVSSEGTLTKYEAQLAAAMQELHLVNLETWKLKYRIEELNNARITAAIDGTKTKVIDELAEAGAQLDNLELRRDLARETITEARKSIEIARNQIAYYQALAEGGESAAR